MDAWHINKPDNLLKMKEIGKIKNKLKREKCIYEFLRYKINLWL